MKEESNKKLHTWAYRVLISLIIGGIWGYATSGYFSYWGPYTNIALSIAGVFIILAENDF